MLFKTLSVSIFILLGWNAIETSKQKNNVIQLTQQLVSIQSRIQDVTRENQLLLKTQADLLKEQLTFSQTTLAEEKLLAEEAKKSEEKKKKDEAKKKKTAAKKKAAAKKKDDAKKKAAPKKKAEAKKPKAKVKSIKDKVTDLDKSIKSIKKLHEKKTMDKALAALEGFKKQTWKIKGDVDKGSFIALFSGIDLTLSKWKKKETGFGTKLIEEKLKKISVATGASK